MKLSTAPASDLAAILQSILALFGMLMTLSFHLSLCTENVNRERSLSVFISTIIDIQIHYVLEYQSCDSVQLLLSLSRWQRELFNEVIWQGRSKENVMKLYGDWTN